MVSIIIPTYNGAHKVINLLRSLEYQTFKNFEVIIVVDGSLDQTETLLKATTFLFNLKVIVQDNRGRAGARNSGYNQATGEIILFFDDDVRLGIDCVKCHWQHHQEVKRSILVGGIEEELNINTLDIQKYKIYLGHKWTKMIAPGGKTLLKENIYLSAANLSMPSEIFSGLGKFDERLRDAEDFDLGVRARLQNIDVYIDPHNFVWHDDYITLESYIKRCIEYRASFIRLLMLKPAYSNCKNIEVSVSYYMLKKIFYFWFSFPFWITLVDKYSILTWIPKAIRYKLYDLIITSHYLYFSPKQDSIIVNK